MVGYIVKVAFLLALSINVKGSPFCRTVYSLGASLNKVPTSCDSTENIS